MRYGLGKRRYREIARCGPWDPPFGWRRRLLPSPPKPRTGDEAGGAGSNRTSVPGRGHHTTALSWTQCQSFLDNIIAGFQPNLPLNDRRNDDRTSTRARIVSAATWNSDAAAHLGEVTNLQGWPGLRPLNPPN